LFDRPQGWGRIFALRENMELNRHWQKEGNRSLIFGSGYPLPLIRGW
jgi:hypothetical protein